MALDVALTFLSINGFEIRQEEERLYEAMIHIANHAMDKDDLASLLEQLCESTIQDS